jgi:D-alanyl-D-alanine carboxypeptidase
MNRSPHTRIVGSALATVALIVLLASATAPVARAQPLPGADLQAALESVVDSPDTMFQGAVLAVRQPDGSTWAGAAGVADLESLAPLSPDARFRAGSIAKTFVATVVLQLVEEGAFGLDDPLSALLPASVVDAFEGSEDVTLRMLLNHTSGIPEWDDEEVDAFIAANPGKVWEASEFLDLAAAKPRLFAPGAGWAYSNTNYNLLGLIIERATGRSWREEVTARVLEPLALAHTYLPDPGDVSINGDYMHGYGVMDGNVVDLSHVDPSMAGAAGGGALVTTASDLTIFLDALLSGSLFRDPATLDAMTEFVDVVGESGQIGYGLGLERRLLPDGTEGIGNAGGTAGYLAFVGYFPDLDLTLAVAVDATVDPTPVIAAALGVLTPAAGAPTPSLEVTEEVLADFETAFEEGMHTLIA